MNPRITVRDIASPFEWGPARPGMAYHHIIPFALLREVWNRFVDQHIATALPEARVAIRQYLFLSARNFIHMDSLMDRMRAENTDQRRASHNQLRPLDVAEAHQLATAAVWPAWDIVEGPSQRSDDPGNWYIDRFTAGLTVQETHRMSAIERLFRDFRAFVGAGAAPGSSSLRALAEACAVARPIVYCEFPIRYRPEMWIEERSGLWRKRRDEERYTAVAR